MSEMAEKASGNRLPQKKPRTGLEGLCFPPPETWIVSILCSTQNEVKECTTQNGFQPALSQIVRSVDLVAQYNAKHVAEWETVMPATVAAAKYT